MRGRPRMKLAHVEELGEGRRASRRKVLDSSRTRSVTMVRVWGGFPCSLRQWPHIYGPFITDGVSEVLASSCVMKAL